MNAYSLLDDPTVLIDNIFIIYKYIVSEKVDHIDNVVFGVNCLTISMILNKISIKSMNHNI